MDRETQDPQQPKTDKGKRKRQIITILAILLVAGGIWYWEEGLKDRIIPKRFGVVVDGLIYRSGQIHPDLIARVLEKNDIDVIVNLTGYSPNNPQHVAEQEAADSLGIEIKRFPLSGDGTGDIDNYKGAVAALIQAAKNKQRVLVHCAAGSQRTGGVIAYYRLFIDNWPPEDVVKEMRKYDWKPDDTALLNYVDEHMQQMAEYLQDEALIEKIPQPLPKLSN